MHEESDENNIVNNSFGENKKLDQLIIMDDVSGVAEISKKFESFRQFQESLAIIAFMFFM